MSATLPVAPTIPYRRWSWWWLVPIVALAVIAGIGVQLLRARGETLTIAFNDGCGLRPGDALRHRGVQVGAVEALALADDGASVRVRVQLHPSAVILAHAGSRFWVVRPQLSMEGATGLDTVVGPHYLAVEPGTGAPAHHFVGIESPPVLAGLQLGGLEIMLDAPSRGGLRPGSAISYRQITVGRVVAVALASDAGAVQVRGYIEPAYATLVRERSRFWNASGIDLAGGLVGGVRIEIDSLQALISGGIAFATPPDAGAAVATGRRFALARRADEAWLAWQPAVAVGGDPVAILPRPVRARLTWAAGRWWSGDDSRDGWLVPIAGGVLAPADLIEAPKAARPGSAMLETNGSARATTSLITTPAGADVVRVALTDLAVAAEAAPKLRAWTAPEDCLLVGDPSAALRPLAAHALGNDGAIADSGLDRSWHGAAVIARVDGALIGLIAVDTKGHARLLPIAP